MMHRAYSGWASDEQMIKVARSVTFPKEIEATIGPA
jgi:hypothetical protein